MNCNMLGIVLPVMVLCGLCCISQCNAKFEDHCYFFGAFNKFSFGVAQIMESGTDLQSAFSERADSGSRKKRFIGGGFRIPTPTPPNIPRPTPHDEIHRKILDAIESSWRNADVNGMLRYLVSRVDFQNAIMTSVSNLDFKDIILSRIDGNVLTNELKKTVNMDTIIREIIQKLEINKSFEKALSSDVDFQQIISDAIKNTDLNQVVQNIVRNIDLEKLFTDSLKAVDIGKLISNWINTLDFDVAFNTVINSIDLASLSKKLFALIKKHFSEATVVQLILDVFGVKDENVTTFGDLIELGIQQTIPGFNLKKFINELKQAGDNVFEPIVNFFQTLEISLIRGNENYVLDSSEYNISVIKENLCIFQSFSQSLTLFVSLGVTGNFINRALSMATKLSETNPSSIKEFFDTVMQVSLISSTAGLFKRQLCNGSLGHCRGC